MIPILRGNVANDERDPVSNVGLEPARATIQPVQDNGAICPSHHVFKGYVENFSNMAQQLGE